MKILSTEYQNFLPGGWPFTWPERRIPFQFHPQLDKARVANRLLNPFHASSSDLARRHPAFAAIGVSKYTIASFHI